MGGAPQNSFNSYSLPYYSPTLQRTNYDTTSTAYSANKSLNYLGTARGRLGYLVTPALLVYGTAGLAYGGVSSNAYVEQQSSTGATDEVGPGGSSYSGTRLGWVAGGGFEWMFMGNWSVKAEYMYYDLGTHSVFMGQSAVFWNGSRSLPGVSTGEILSLTNFASSTHFNGNIVRAGVSYHFNMGSAPVVAKF